MISTNLRWSIFSVLLGALMGLLLLVQTWGDRGTEANAAPVVVNNAPTSVGVESLRSPTPLTDAERARAAILAAARCQGVEHLAWKMQNVVYRESRFDPKACGTHGEMGMAQFMPALWNHAVREMGQPSLSPWIPEDAAQVMAFCWAHGYEGHWRAHR
jgi:hypothetical protein